MAKTDIARLTGLGRSSVTAACRKALADAVVGSKVNAAHPACIAWLSERGVDVTLLRVAHDPATFAEAIGKKGAPRSVEALLDMPLREIIERFGSVDGLDAWLSRRKRIAETRRVELQNEQVSSAMISADLVRDIIIGSFLETLALRLLRDVPAKVTAHAKAMLSTGASAEEIQRFIHDEISGILKHTKREIQKSIQAAKKQQKKFSPDGEGAEGSDA